MKLKDLISIPCGLRYMVEKLDIQSGVARRMLMESDMMTHAESIQNRYEVLKRYIEVATDTQNLTTIRNILFRLGNLKDLRTTLQNLCEGRILDEIELFEIKHLSMLYTDIRQQMNTLDLRLDDLQMERVINLLDPENLRIPTFYIYDAYSPALAQLRKELKADPTNEVIFTKVQDEEQQVRTTLSQQLRKYQNPLSLALQHLVETDIYFAQALQCGEMHLCIPTLGNATELNDMRNPEVEESLRNRGLEYQTNDICLGAQPTVLTGSNMGGKTVVLKTVALCQLLTQFGFGVPAKKATMRIFDAIYCQMADGQSTEMGLSSFGAEMKNLNEIIAAARQNKNILALIDEPARTTNPIEGTALVSSLLDTLRPTGITLLLVTHYLITAHACACLRVRGLENGKMNYALVPTKEGDVPHEAIRVAEQLGVDTEWLQCAKQYLQ